MAVMAKDLRNAGISLFECICAIFLLQLLICFAWPSLQGFIAQKTSRQLLLDLKSTIEWARWQAVVSKEEIYLEFTDNGWVLYSATKLLRHADKVRQKIIWHGFSGAQRFVFYPDIHRNYLNGIFQIGPYKLWLNRLGHMRESNAV